MATNIILTDPSVNSQVKITQLYTHLELYSAGEPAAHTLFVLGRAPLSVLNGPVGDQMLIIDPPLDAPQRFRLDANVATLSTGNPVNTGLPQMQTTPGGVAHIRIGDHFLDIYTQQQGNIIYFPALGIVCSGAFGSDATLPSLAVGSDGNEELATLRLLARLIKQSRFQLFIPQLGSHYSNTADVLSRLAGDVAYLHHLQRVMPEIVKRGDDLPAAMLIAESLLPADRRSPICRAVHQRNFQLLFENFNAMQ